MLIRDLSILDYGLISQTISPRLVRILMIINLSDKNCDFCQNCLRIFCQFCCNSIKLYYYGNRVYWNDLFMTPSKPKEPRTITISLRITQGLDEILEDTARKMRVSKSQLIRDGIAHLNSPETGKAA